MKKILLIVAIFAIACSLSAVNWRVNLNSMEDNEWWGATLTVYVNGVAVLNQIAYEGGWDERYFNVENGDLITTLYTPADMFNNENIYSIWNHYNELIVISGAGYSAPNSITNPIVVSIPTSSPLPAYSPMPMNDSYDMGIAGTLNWSYGAGTEHYQLWLGTPDNMTMVASGRVTTGTGSYNYSALQPLTNYSWQVKSFNFLSSNSTESPIWNFYTEVPAVTDFPFVTDFEMEYILPFDWVSITGSGMWFPNNYAGGYGWSGGSVRARFRDITGTTPFHLITPPLNMSSLDAIELSFQYAYATYLNRVDKLEIYCSSDYGANYQLHYTMLGGDSGELNSGGSQSTDFIPSSWQWGTKTLSIPLGTNKIRFTAVSANGNNLYLDNITLQQGFIDTVFGYYPTSMEFIDTTIGESSAVTITPDSHYGYEQISYVLIANTGTQNMIIARENVYITGPDANQFWFNPQYLPATISANGAHFLAVRFTPTSPGIKQAELHIVYHGQVYSVSLSGNAHSESGELWQRFEGNVFPPDMWSQIGHFEVDPGIGMFAGQSPLVIIDVTEPEQMLITPVLELDGTINNLGFYHVGLNNNLGYGSCTLQMKYQPWGSNTWLNLGAPISYNQPEKIRRSIYSLSGLAHGLYRFGFAVTSTFYYPNSASAVLIDNVYGPRIFNNGVLTAPSANLATDRSLSWSPVINAQHYQILGSDRPDGTFNLLANTANNYWQDPISAINKRFYRVKAMSNELPADRSHDSTKHRLIKDMLYDLKIKMSQWEK